MQGSLLAMHVFFITSFCRFGLMVLLFKAKKENNMFTVIIT